MVISSILFILYCIHYIQEIIPLTLKQCFKQMLTAFELIIVQIEVPQFTLFIFLLKLYPQAFPVPLSFRQGLTKLPRLALTCSVAQAGVKT